MGEHLLKMRSEAPLQTWAERRGRIATGCWGRRSEVEGTSPRPPPPQALPPGHTFMRPRVMCISWLYYVHWRMVSLNSPAVMFILSRGWGWGGRKPRGHPRASGPLPPARPSPVSALVPSHLAAGPTPRTCSSEVSRIFCASEAHTRSLLCCCCLRVFSFLAISSKVSLDSIRSRLASYSAVAHPAGGRVGRGAPRPPIPIPGFLSSPLSILRRWWALGKGLY